MIPIIRCVSAPLAILMASRSHGSIFTPVNGMSGVFYDNAHVRLLICDLVIVSGGEEVLANYLGEIWMTLSFVNRVMDGWLNVTIGHFERGMIIQFIHML